MAENARRVVLSGCSGGGKSSLLRELSRRGHAIFAEAGREIVKEQLACAGEALPWVDAARSGQLLLARSLEKYHAAPNGLSFYDRSFIEPLSWYTHNGAELPQQFASLEQLRYADDVFLAPPWPEIYVVDHERRHDIADAIAEYERILDFFPALGYTVHILPKTGVAERVDFVERVLKLA